MEKNNFNLGVRKMKKVLSIVLAAVLTFSLTACANNAKKANGNKEKATNAAVTNNNKNEAKDDKKEENTEEAKKEEVKYETLGALLNGVSEKDYYYDDIDTIKILDEKKKEAYSEKSKAVLDKEMADKKIDANKAKVYSYYKNVNGDKYQKDYVVVYGDDKVPTTVYEVEMTISDKDEPSLKETKENKEMITDEFKKLFKDDIEKPAEEEK